MSDQENDETSSPGDFDSTVSYTGRVKWFNNKAGYGFTTIVGNGECQRNGEDVFVHHSGVKTSSEQYKYLVQGEYVSFTLKESDNEAHPFQADNLTGVYGGKLMCETRAEQRQQREEHDSSTGDNEQRSGGYRGGGNRGGGGQTYDRGGGGGGGGDRGGGGERKRGRQSFRLHGQGPRDENAVWTLVRENRGENRGQNSQRRQRHRGADEEQNEN